MCQVRIIAGLGTAPAGRALGDQAGASSIAFPCISTGAYGYPKTEACELAVSTVAEWVDSHSTPKTVVFCCFDGESAALYRRALEDLQPER